MVLPSHIEKFPPLIRSKTYDFLREKGLDYLRQMASETWTDHNIHDPGISILEMLCYALCDLGYKTDMPLPDILAEQTPCDIKMQGDKNKYSSLFTARQILPCNPLTELDLRKTIIDVPGVKNSWLTLLEKSKPPIYLDCKNDTLTFEKKKGRDRINIQGIYDVILEFEKDPNLGDLNLWNYMLEVPPAMATKDSHPFTLHFAPLWPRFFSRKQTLDTNTPGYFSSLTSVPNTSIYKGNLIFTIAKKEVAFPFNLNSPLQKNDFNKGWIEGFIQDHLLELREYLALRVSRCTDIATDVWKTLHGHRNLCEDYEDLLPISAEEIGVCADIEVRPGADMEKVLGEVYFELDKFLSPPIPFYSLEELQAKGMSPDEIFLGPALRHGFIQDEDLIRSEFKKSIHVSDIIQILMDIEGVSAIKKLQLSKFFLGEVLNDGEEWCLKITPNRVTRFHMDASKIVFYKDLIPYNARKIESLEHLKHLRGLEYRPRLASQEIDIPIPKGKNRGLLQHQSIQNDFPLVYGIGPEGLPPSATGVRKAQAKQLKGYLKLADQILANYCAQLAQTKDLFSLNPHIHKTYFSQQLTTLPETYRIQQSTLDRLQAEGWTGSQIDLLVPFLDKIGMEREPFLSELQSTLGLSLLNTYKELILELTRIPGLPVPGLPNGENLIREFVVYAQGLNPNINWDDEESYGEYWDQYKLILKDKAWAQLCEKEELLENAYTYQERKNKFLDHLMARFAEQFTDYVLLISHLEGPKAPEDLIEDKLAFLKDYPLISHDRGKGHNTLLPYQPDNVSGLEMRASRLVGINNWHNRRLANLIESYFEFYQEIDNDGIDEYRFRLLSESGKVLLSSSTKYYEMESAKAEIETVLKHGVLPERYEFLLTKNGKHYFNLIDETGEVIARRIQYYGNKEKAEAARDRIVAYIQQLVKKEEGFHLLEHLLIRPFSKNHSLLNVCVSEDCDSCLGFRDPYSFRATVVVPYWPQRFQNMDFRKFFEKALRAEAPAHIHLKICWVDKEDMKRFEESYFKWLDCKAIYLPNQKKLREAQEELVKVLGLLRSVYPETHLHDCEEEGETSSILLNHSKLGSTKGT